MLKPRIYIDTSVIGGCLDEEFRRWSETLMDRFVKGEAVAVVSSVTIDEIREGPEAVRALLQKLSAAETEEVVLDQEAMELADAYVAAGAIGGASLADAQHVAMASLHRVDALVSWNFRHIVNLSRIRAFNSVNLRRGLGQLEIRSPREVLDEG